MIQIYTLHLSHLQQSNAQLIRLREQQNKFQDKINSLINDLNIIQNQVQSKQKTSDKIIILQDAIKSQRQQIFKLNQNIIPPFNLSKNACKEMADDQKINILTKLTQSKKYISQLQKITLNVPQCDEIQAIKTDLSKQSFIIDSIEKIVYTKCQNKIILTPTIFQTNIYAKNWIIGNQTFDDIVEQYYQRSIKYHNITNCPLSHPFFKGKKCIECTNDNPVFNIQTKECVKCDQGQSVNNSLRICQVRQRYTDYNKVSNYFLQGAKLPPIDKNKQSCPQDKPFFNDKKCINCSLPSYFSFGDKQCHQCDQEYFFDIDMHKCRIIEKFELTLLQNTKWITNDGNVSRILQERQQILQDNKTSKKYIYCPSITPYYNGKKCIYCAHEFNLDQKKCDSAINGLVYNKNIRAYVVPEQNKETDPKNSNYTSKQPLNDTKVPNCNKTNPFYDGVACIQCPKVFNIFNADSKTCSRCNIQQIYNDSTHKCDLRDVIWISTNNNRLLATNKTSIQDYQKQIKQKVKQNPQAIIIPCRNQSDYSNYSSCVHCKVNQFFNVEIKKCVICSGTFNKNDSKCYYKSYKFVNLNASNIVDLQANKTSQQQKINNYIKNHPNSQICPIDQPYSDGLKCITCPDLFNYSSLNCTSCPQYHIYSNKTFKCQKAVMLTNLTTNSILLADNQTMQDLQKQQNDTKQNTSNWASCPKDKPFAYNGSYCFNCTEPNYLFDAKLQICSTCQRGKVYISANHTCQKEYYLSNLDGGKFIEQDNYTIQNVNSSQILLSKNKITISCQQSRPYATSTGCMSCNQSPNILFNLKTKVCVPCPKNKPHYLKNISICSQCNNNSIYDKINMKCISTQYFTNITSAKNYIQTSQYNLNKIQQEKSKINSSKIKQCSSNQPFWNGIKCISCNQSKPYFDLQQKICIDCSNYNKSTHKCDKSNNHYSNLSNPNWVTNDGEVDRILDQIKKQKQVKGAIQCPNGSQFYNNQTKQCVSCDIDKFYNYDTQSCISCNPKTFQPNTHKCIVQDAPNTYHTNLQSPNLVYSGQSKKQFEQQYNQRLKKYPKIKDCPLNQPYWTGKKCIECPTHLKYFNLKYQRCQICQNYSQQDKQCRSKITGQPIKTQPNIEKMYSSLI